MSCLLPSPFLTGIVTAIVLATSCVQLATSACSRPETPDHSTLIYERHSSPPARLPEGYRVRVVCNNLFQLVGGGFGVMNCTDGEWSHTFICEAVCDRLPPLPRGTIAYAASATRARYSCTTPGFRLEGQRKRRCLSDGTWSGEAPVCRGIPMCEEPELSEHLTQRRVVGRRREGLWIIGSILHFSCEEPFSILSQHYPSIGCTRRGWNATVPQCTELRCPPLLETIVNGTSSAENRSYSPGDAIEYACNRGYRALSQPWRVCSVRTDHDGSTIPVWDGVTPRCEETQCARPKRIENGETIVFSTSVGGKTTFRCHSGYELIGDAILACQENGQWNETIPVCDNGETHCPPLATPLNGYKTGDQYSKSQTVEFSCKSGYALAGSSVRECLSDGQWSGEEARCIGPSRTFYDAWLELECTLAYTIPLLLRSLDFDDVNQISAVLGENLDRLALDYLFENEVQSSVRFTPSQQYGVDLYFLFDASTSDGEKNFDKAKKFAKELVRKIGVTERNNSLRVGAIAFSDVADVRFHTTEFKSTEDVINLGIEPIQYIGGGTDITSALTIVERVMIPQTEFREGSYKTVFLITDGEANLGGDPQRAARRLEDLGVKIRCLGISQNASRPQLLRIGSRPHREHVFFLKDYGTLQDVVSRVVNETVDYSECGISHNTVPRARVVGGNDANPGAWPWQALLTITKGVNVSQNCGGVLIDSRWVLTAAHCVHGNPDTVEVGLGITDKTKGDRQYLTVDEWIIHPQYNASTFQNDIALLKLERPVVLNANVRLVCLPIKERAHKLVPPNPGGQSAVVTGWGHTKQRGANEHVALEPANVLQQLGLPLKSREDCEESLDGDPEEEYFDESMFCAGFEGAVFGACQGDSGGPLVKKAVREKQRRWTLIGLVSWGRGCAVQDELDFFTNVPYFMDWITETMNPPQQEEERDAEAGD